MFGYARQLDPLNKAGKKVSVLVYKQHGLTKKDQNMPGSTAAKLESVNERGVETGGRAGFSLAYIRL